MKHSWLQRCLHSRPLATMTKLVFSNVSCIILCHFVQHRRANVYFVTTTVIALLIYILGQKCSVIIACIELFSCIP